MSGMDRFEAWWKTLEVYDPALKALAGSAWMEAIRSSGAADTQPAETEPSDEASLFEVWWKKHAGVMGGMPAFVRRLCKSKARRAWMARAELKPEFQPRVQGLDVRCSVVCQASKADGVICPHDSCDIEQGVRERPVEQPDPVPDLRLRPKYRHKGSIVDVLGDPVGAVTMQKAEDPDEWVVQDRLPPRKDLDQICWGGGNWHSDWHKEWQFGNMMHGDYPRFGGRLNVRCRRRDLPPVEKPEQWPKYYTGIVTGTAYVKRLSPEECVVVETDGTETDTMRWSDWDERKRTEITEAEAMALIQKPEPQPAKTRVRLWLFFHDLPDVLSVVATIKDNTPSSKGWQEIHHDAEGFYVEQQ